MIFPNTTFSQTPPIDAGVSQTLAKWRSANYSDVRYKLNITLEKGAPLMKGDIEIRVNLTEEGAENDLILDWRTTQFANNKDKPYAYVTELNGFSPAEIINGKAQIVRRDSFAPIINEHLILPKNLLKTGENVIKINFASPIKTSGAAVTRYVDKEDNAEYVYSLFVPSDASTAFPVFDQPDLKARFRLAVDAPEDWKVISNTYSVEGKVKKEDQVKIGWIFKGTGHFFEETKPISTYVFAFAAGDFEDFTEKREVDAVAELKKEGKARSGDGITIIPLDDLREKLGNRIFVRKSQLGKFKQDAAEVFRLNREGVKFLEDWFDYKFPFPKYDLVLIPEFPFGGMEHAGATFLREDRVIFPTEPTKNDFITRANVIFHEAAHQWFGDTVTMKWFDDLWLKEGFAEFMAYKTLEKVMPEYNAWKIFYERNKQAAYLTDVTRGTTPIYQEIPNLSSAKSAYGNIVYRKAPSFLRQAEFYLGEDKLQTAVRAFLKKHEFANASWQDLVNEFAEVKVAEEKNSEYYLKLSDRDKSELERFTRWSIEKEWAEFWVEKRGTAVYRITPRIFEDDTNFQMTFAPHGAHTEMNELFSQEATIKDENYNWLQDVKILKVFKDGERKEETRKIGYRKYETLPDAERKSIEEFRKKNKELGRKFEIEQKPKLFEETEESRKSFDEYVKKKQEESKILYVFPNYQDYGYGIFLLDEQSRAYVLENIGAEKDDFLRSMMWGSLWDSLRFYELAPEDYVKFVIKNINVETDESTIQTLLGRVSTAMNYYLTDAQAKQFALKIEAVLLNRMRDAKTVGQRITFYRAYLNIASSDYSQEILKKILKSDGKPIEIETVGTVVGKIPPIEVPPLKTKDKFDIVTKLLILENKRILGNNEAEKLLAELEKTETDDAAKRYAYAARAGIATAENKAKYWKDFTENKEISESWIESAFNVWNTPKHAELTLPYLEKALAELPNLKRTRKIFFVNGWLSAFIGGQKSAEALNIVNKFLADNPNLDKDLRNKILENADNLERAVKIREKFGMEK
jgi:hypothetical protein